VRTFLAYTLPTDIKHLAVETKNSLQGLNCRDIKWVEDENLHVTLQFLGEVREDKLKELDSIISEALKDAPIPEFTTLGVEAFPANNPRVIWIKLTATDEQIRFHKKLVKQLQKLNPEIEYKSYRAHITLGRIRDYLPPVILSKMLAYPINNSTFKALEVILYKSILAKKGPQYVPLSEYVTET